ncbi:MAG: hypothetical protein A4E53_00957 [Pelotomaculum sp. PtaB.Bin104]|nr:MAG: hypothetical protein A4E53_00957 [Pelotomaculum sp. PtaB.Bin104]
MYPQTHVFFAEAILKKQRDHIALGSILPDILVGCDISHCEAHSQGMDIFKMISQESYLKDFGLAVASHGFVPRGLDYFGDEKYLDYEKGYCFEKARQLILKTVEVCNIPPEMGWWKAHNIVEMGVETLVSSTDHYSEQIKSALNNIGLIDDVDELLNDLWQDKELNFAVRMRRFAKFVEIEKASPESLAKKFQLQMQVKHKVDINVTKVARLIGEAAELVTQDINEFFRNSLGIVKKNIANMDQD